MWRGRGVSDRHHRVSALNEAQGCKAASILHEHLHAATLPQHPRHLPLLPHLQVAQQQPHSVSVAASLSSSCPDTASTRKSHVVRKMRLELSPRKH